MSSFEVLIPPPEDRRRWLELVDDPVAHEEIARDLACLRSVDVEAPGEPAPLSGWLRVAVWNVERGRDPAALAGLIARTGAHLVLLSEVDVGMARTGNVDVARELGGYLSAGTAFAVEFVELGLGKRADLPGVVDSVNRCGLHGNAIVTKTRLLDPDVVRLSSGDWFTHSRGEPRVGGRSALVATILLDDVEVDVASVHLESHSDAALRAAQMTTLLDRLDDRGRRPAIVGGDFNTFGAPLTELADRTSVSRMRTRDPTRFSWPVRFEPLFEVAAGRGFAWVEANVAAPTTTHGPDGLPDHVPIKLDWILVRGLEARRPTVVRATGPDGTALSDHDLLAVSVRIPS